jgi:hypothetical protein
MWVKRIIVRMPTPPDQNRFAQPMNHELRARSNRTQLRNRRPRPGWIGNFDSAQHEKPQLDDVVNLVGAATHSRD